MKEIFPFGKPVSGEHLVGRDDFVKEIIAMLKNGQSLMLTGPRRYGKTSVIMEVLRRLKLEGFF